MGKRSKWIPAVLLPAVLACSLFSVEGAGPEEDFAIVFTQIPVVPDGEDCEGEFNFRSPPAEGSRIVLLAPGTPDGDLRVLTEGFAAACDPAVSPDGRHLLFSAQPSSGDPWNLWEMSLNDGTTRQITRDLGDCREPAYLARSSITPPDFTDKVRWVVFTSTAPGTYDESGREPAPALYVQNTEPIANRGIVTWRTTFNLSHDFSPVVLDDGRVLFSSWQQLGGRHSPHGMVALMTVNWAGTGLNPFYGNHTGASVKSMACEMPDRTVVFVESDGSTCDGSGQLASVSFRRPLHSRRPLSNGTGRYRTPQSFPGGGLAVSHASGDGDYGIHLFDPETGEPGRLLYDDPGWHEIDPLAVIPGPEPQGRITIVVDSKETGFLQCLNVYDSDREEAASVEKGAVKRVRFVEGIPLSAGDGTPTSGPFARTRILGEAPVEPDGSFLVQLPADTPFYIQSLDENGMALQTMSGWMWVRRGSRRGCIGCHENKELAPENRTTDALRKAKPHALLTPPRERRTVDFVHDVRPIVEERCLPCHQNPSPDAGLILGSDPVGPSATAYQSLVRAGAGRRTDRRYVQLGSARTSLLIQMLNGETGGGRITHPEMRLSPEELAVFAEWIDLGAQWDARERKED